MIGPTDPKSQAGFPMLAWTQEVAFRPRFGRYLLTRMYSAETRRPSRTLGSRDSSQEQVAEDLPRRVGAEDFMDGRQ